MKKFGMIAALVMTFGATSAMAEYACQEQRPQGRPRVVYLDVLGDSLTLKGIDTVQGVYKATGASSAKDVSYKGKKGVVRVEKDLNDGAMEGAIHLDFLPASFFCRMM